MKLSEVKSGDILVFETDFQICITIILNAVSSNRIETDAFRMTKNGMCSLWKSYILIWDGLKEVDDKNKDMYISSLDVYYPIAQAKNKKRAIICIFKAEE